MASIRNEEEQVSWERKKFSWEENFFFFLPIKVFLGRKLFLHKSFLPFLCEDVLVSLVLLINLSWTFRILAHEEDQNRALCLQNIRPIVLLLEAKKTICCHFTQWVGRKAIYFIFYFIFCHFNQSIGKNFFILLGAKFTSMHVLSVHYVTIFFFTLFDFPLLFVRFFRVTLITVSSSWYIP